ncbi:hypothetical protein V2J09_003235 [Rumex salicifolius]
MLSGAIPSTIASNGNLNALHFNSNRFSGELPSSMKNCTQLVILELGNNFSGSVPFWLGDNLQSLIVLSLRSNSLSGYLPSNLCQLQRLQVSDLSGILANESSGNLPQLNVFDLSDNHLMGEIPSGVTSLKYLRSLDLSRNNLNGSIPDKIDQLRFPEVLRLSSNRLRGEIPQSLAGLTFLNTLNLSSNNLTGRIPKSTQLQSFDPSSYGGNPGLCGEPLPTKCPGDKVLPGLIVIDQTGKKDHKTFDMEAFYAALGTGFAFGLFGILGILNFHAPSRHAFFHMASEVGDWIFVRTFLCQSKIKRRLVSESRKQSRNTSANVSVGFMGSNVMCA